MYVYSLYCLSPTDTIPHISSNIPSPPSTPSSSHSHLHSSRVPQGALSDSGDEGTEVSKDVKHLEFQLLHNLRQLQVTVREMGGGREREGRGRGGRGDREGRERGEGGEGEGRGREGEGGVRRGRGWKRGAGRWRV